MAIDLKKIINLDGRCKINLVFSKYGNKTRFTQGFERKLRRMSLKEKSQFKTIISYFKMKSK